jgi:hypothetical protein
MKDRNKVLIILGLAVATNHYTCVNHLRIESYHPEEISIREDQNRMAKKSNYIFPHWYEFAIESRPGKKTACLYFRANPIYAEYNPFWARDQSTGEASEQTSFSDRYTNYDLDGNFEMLPRIGYDRIDGKICLERR